MAAAWRRFHSCGYSRRNGTENQAPMLYSGPSMRSLYTLLLYLATPAVLLYLFLRGLRSRAYLGRWAERFGHFDPPRRTGGIVLHAVSMGEVNAAAMLAQELLRRFPDDPLCLTTLTPTGSARVRELFGERVFHVYAPLDLPGAVRRFLGRTEPRLLVIMETEIWPNLYHQAHARGIPILVVNARISERSVGAYRRLRRLTGAALRKVSRIGAQSPADRQRLLEIGAREPQITVTGNMKFDARMPPSLTEEGEAIRLAWGTQRRVLVAGSTHEGDERALLTAFNNLLRTFPDALLVLVPRHPERFARAAQLARQAGLTVSLRSSSPSCPRETQCYVVDAMGELLRYYAAGDTAFVGGSIEPIGGHNPLEPAALSRPVLFGPHTQNFAEITRQLLECEAAVRVADAGQLEDAVRRLFSAPELRDRMGRAGFELVRSGQGAVGRTLELIEAQLTAAAD
jgi:3-deoxy-D-manno-octulosonic-acid transferase